jgi:intracellular septation protein A
VPPATERPGPVAILGGLFANVGPLVVFYAFDWTLGLKPAIVASAVFSIGEVAWRLWRREPITFLFKVTAITTVGLGALDIVTASPRFLSYEAFVTNAAFGGWFAWLMVKGPGPLVEELVRQRPELADRGDLVGLVRVLLAIVVAWHVVTAVAYLWIAARYPLEQAIGIRALFGNVSLVPLVAAVWFGLRPLHAFAARRGWVESA